MKKKRRLQPRLPEPHQADRLQVSPKGFPRSVAVLVVVLTVVCFLVIHVSHLAHLNKNKQSFFYDQNIPVMITFDAYYYLRLTSDLIKGQYHDVDEKRPGSERPRPVPLLVSMTALIYQITDIPIERVAFYLPPVLSSLMFIVYLLWGYTLGGPFVALAASLAGTSSYGWSRCTWAGNFDTDCLIPVFVYLIMFCMYQFANTQSPMRFIHLIGSLCLTSIFGLWWTPGTNLGLILIAFTYSTSFFVISSRGERLLKICSLTLMSAACLLAILGHFGIFPSPLNGLLGPEFEYLNLKMKSSSALFPNVAESISELKPLSIEQFAAGSGGNEIAILISTVGLFILFYKKREMSGFLLPGLLFGIASFFSRRFLIFYVPVYAIGIGYLLGEVFLNSKWLQKIPNLLGRWGIWASTLILLLYPSFYSTLTEHVEPIITAHDVHLARSIADVTGSQSVIWAWWDMGYFLQYITGRKTFIDGGMQSPERTFITAYPLACEDALLSRNWMRFFTSRDLSGLETVASRLGDIPRAMSFLKDALGNPSELDNILDKYGQNNSPFWRQYLFPEAQTFLYLDYATLYKIYWWYYFGTWDFEHKQGIHPVIIRRPVAEAPSLEVSGLFMESGRVFRIVKTITVDPAGRGIDEGKMLDSKGQNGNKANLWSGSTVNKKTGDGLEAAMIVDKKTSFVFLLEKKLFQSLVLRLLFQDPSCADQFTPITYVPWAGGSWSLE
jgi:hypothetical protein